MLTLVKDGLRVLLEYWPSILLIFIAFVGFGLFTLRQLRIVEKDPISAGFMSLGVGATLLSLLAFAIVAIAYFLPALLAPGAFLLLASAVILLGRETLMSKFATSWRGILLAFLVLSVYLTLRLAWLNYVLLPPHSDSPVHYQIISDLISRQPSGPTGLSLGNILQRYYHFGFHSLAAWLVTTTNISIGDAISLLGQVFLLIAPLSIFALTYSITKDGLSASFAALLAAIGWAMPAFAVNWGKFPALGALAVAPAILAATVTAMENKSPKRTMIFWLGALSLSVSLLHSRMTILLMFALLAYFLVSRMDIPRGISLLRSIAFAIFGAISLLPHYAIFRDFYWSYSIFIVLLVLFPFAIRSHTEISVGIIVFSFLMWIALIADIKVGGRTLEVLDEQFVAMTLFVPLSLIAGLGLAGVVRTFRFEQRAKWMTGGVIAAMVAINIQPAYFYPDPCCNIFTADDESAIQWITENTPSQALFLISSAESGFQSIGTDAGIWITPLTGRPANKIPYETIWSSPVEIEKICPTEAQNIYVYSTGREFSFLQGELSDSERLRNVLTVGGTAIQEVMDC